MSSHGSLICQARRDQRRNSAWTSCTPEVFGPKMGHPLWCFLPWKTQGVLCQKKGKKRWKHTCNNLFYGCFLGTGKFNKAAADMKSLESKDPKLSWRTFTGETLSRPIILECPISSYNTRWLIAITVYGWVAHFPLNQNFKKWPINHHISTIVITPFVVVETI